MPILLFTASILRCRYCSSLCSTAGQPHHHRYRIKRHCCSSNNLVFVIIQYNEGLAAWVRLCILCRPHHNKDACHLQFCRKLITRGNHFVDPGRNRLTSSFHSCGCLYQVECVPTFESTDLPAKASHHRIVCTINLIADFRNAVRDIENKT